MRTFVFIPIAAFLLVIVGVGLAGQSTLYQREVNERNPGGKDLVMNFDERRRDEKTSLVKVTYKSGYSVASAMFIMRGFYDIARIRGMSHFIKLKEWDAEDGDRMYLVGFSNDPTVSPVKYFGVDMPSDPSELKYLAVKNFAQIFGGRR